MQYHAIPCNTMQYHAIPCNTMKYHAIPCDPMKYHTIPCSTLQYHAIPCITMQYHAIPCMPSNCWRSVPLPCGQYMAIFILRSFNFFSNFWFKIMVLKTTSQLTYLLLTGKLPKQFPIFPKHFIFHYCQLHPTFLDFQYCLLAWPRWDRLARRL